nr:MAG TPA: hypothetical protein [Caudoviricetes sp.]
MMYTNDSELSLSTLRDCWTLEPLLSLVAGLLLLYRRLNFDNL